MKRTLRINFNNDEAPRDLEISKAAYINADVKTLMQLEQLKDGTYRLIFTRNLIEDFSKIKSFEMIRE